jgi:hypothetical protein
MNIIFTLHAILFFSLLIIPFVNHEKLLQSYSVLIPFLFFHWSVNDDTCALTQLEAHLTGSDTSQTFMHRLVSPVYKMEDTDVNNLMKSTLFFLWMFVQYRIGHFDFVREELKILKSRFK